MSLEKFEESLTRSPQSVYEFLNSIDQASLRSYSDCARGWYKDLDADWKGNVRGHPREILSQTVPFAVLSVCSFSEIKKLRCYGGETQWTEKALLRRSPEWRNRWAHWLVETVPQRWPDVRELVRRGVVRKSEQPAHILGMVLAAYRGEGAYELLSSDPELTKDIPRLFEVEGGGETSLAAVDKYLSETRQWSTALCTLAEQGKLSRDDLLTWSLQALNRDFAAFRAGWFSRFLLRLKPTTKEIEKRLPLLYPLLRSRVSPTVSLTLKLLTKCERLSAPSLLELVPYLWMSSKKGQIKMAIKLLRKHADKAQQWKALQTLPEHPDPDVQRLALENLKAIVESPTPEQIEKFQVHCQDLSASVRQQWSNWLKLDCSAALSSEFVVETTELETPLELKKVETESELIELGLALLEAQEDPWDIERFLDGVLRIRPTDQSQPASLGKRAKQKRSADPVTAGLSNLVLAWLGETSSWKPLQEIQFPKSSALRSKILQHLPPWCVPPSEEIPSINLENFLLNRLSEIACFLGQGHTDPEGSLSWPTSRAGFLTKVPGLQDSERARSRPVDFAQALLRLPPETTYSLSPNSPELWRQAQSERDTVLHWDYHIETKTFEISGKVYTHRTLHLNCPARLFHWSPEYSETPASRRWQSLVCPAQGQRWLLQGLCELANNIDWGQVQWADFIYLEKLASNSKIWGRVESLLAVIGMSCKEVTQVGLSVDAISGALTRELLTSQQLGEALIEAGRTGLIKANRWAKAFTQLTDYAGPDVLFESLERLFSQVPSDWKVSPLLAVFAEIQALSRRPITREETKEYLNSFSGQSKAAKQARRLLAFS